VKKMLSGTATSVELPQKGRVTTGPHIQVPWEIHSNYLKTHVQNMLPLIESLRILELLSRNCLKRGGLTLCAYNPLLHCC